MGAEENPENGEFPHDGAHGDEWTTDETAEGENTPAKEDEPVDASTDLTSAEEAAPEVETEEPSPGYASPSEEVKVAPEDQPATVDVLDPAQLAREVNDSLAFGPRPKPGSAEEPPDTAPNGENSESA